MENCKNCRFFRPYRPLSQLLARELGHNDAQVASQLVSIMQDEYRVKGNEAQKRAELMITEEVKWDEKPAMSDYCGFLESKGVYFIYEIKNAGGECKDFKKLDNTRHECATCQHQILGDGEAKDRQAIQEYKQIATNSIALDKGGDHGLGEYIQRISMVKAFEAAQSYYAGKLTFRQPDYLSICGVYSTDRDFVPCVLQNPHEVCNDYTDRVAKQVEISSLNESIDPLLKGLEEFRQSC
jgi:hypothetical protein